jgi:Uma2 family endonuclease
MSTLPKTHLTPEQYLEIERRAERKSEYYDGEMFAMPGAAEEHGLISGNLFAQLHNQLRSSACRPFMANLRVNVPVTGLYTYPDIVVACGERKFIDAEADTLLNPVFIAEILSPSTEAYNRGRKFEHYRTIPTLNEYLVAQDRIQVDLYTRQPAGAWLLTSANQLTDTMALPPIQCSVLLADLYEGLSEFSPAS